MDFSEFWKVLRLMLGSEAMIGFAALSGMCSLAWGYFAHRTRVSLVGYRIISGLFTAPTIFFLAMALFGGRPDQLLHSTGAFGLVLLALGVWLASPALGWLAGYVASFCLNLVVPHKEASNVHSD